MKKRNSVWVMIFISLCALTVRADIAPDPGYTRVSSNLVIQAEEDFADYRFFLQSPIDVEEIFLKKGETLIEAASRGGGAKRYGKLVAVPKDVFAKLPNAGDLKFLHGEIQSRKVEGVIEIANHSFQKTVPLGEKGNSHAAVYRLERDGSKGIKTTPQSGSSVSAGTYSIEKSFTPIAVGLMVGGGFISAAVIFLGIWFFRRKRQSALK